MKKTNIGLALLLAFVAVSFTACVNGKGDIVTQTVNVSGFNRISHSTVGDVILVADVNQYIEVSSHENIIDALKFTVSGNQLKIGNKPGRNIGNYQELKIYIHTPPVEDIRISGSGSISGANVVASDFSAKISGSGDINITGITSESVETDISGSGKITLSGLAGKSDFEISGSGSVRAFDLVSDKTKVAISGSGGVETTTVTSLDVKISGSGSVRYKGQPAINTDMSGSGSIQNAN